MQKTGQGALDAIDESRKSLGISRKAFLKLAGICERNWYDWRCGRCGPTMRSMGKIERALRKLATEKAGGA
jgi:hypothetical protein